MFYVSEYPYSYAAEYPVQGMSKVVELTKGLLRPGIEARVEILSRRHLARQVGLHLHVPHASQHAARPGAIIPKEKLRVRLPDLDRAGGGPWLWELHLEPVVAAGVVAAVPHAAGIAEAEVKGRLARVFPPALQGRHAGLQVLLLGGGDAPRHEVMAVACVARAGKGVLAAGCVGGASKPGCCVLPVFIFIFMFMFMFIRSIIRSIIRSSRALVAAATSSLATMTQHRTVREIKRGELRKGRMRAAESPADVGADLGDLIAQDGQVGRRGCDNGGIGEAKERDVPKRMSNMEDYGNGSSSVSSVITKTLVITRVITCVSQEFRTLSGRLDPPASLTRNEESIRILWRPDRF
ncbi:hypothetical protein E4U43_003659 [Claviceps pusilla]|uniref:Uncharacterized protein n=1 Tax=Claviceps pusilla TaxID=123648 RepID=A0A9P7N734_9HYPO|nr:hypothetical protein E4U43_003659 [Claviceps pusilla]